MNKLITNSVNVFVKEKSSSITENVFLGGKLLYSKKKGSMN